MKFPFTTTPILIAAWCVSCCCSALAEDPIDFDADVKPIFAAHCVGCHGPKKQESGLRLDQRASLLRNTDNGNKPLVIGRPTESMLVKVIRGESDQRMPPEGDGEPLTSKQIETLVRWIQQGAVWPGQMESSPNKIESDHWSFRPLTAVQPPAIALEHAIDRFIVAKLAERQLSLSPPAGLRTLIRRASLIVTGLPPTPRQITTVINDPDGFDAGYEKFVDSLLASTTYGERWAQHWLDVIRWAETVGFETNLERQNAWHYRDWVIRSLNDDKPYDRFVFEQIAGDTVGQDAALGFLVAGPANLPGQIGRDEEAMRQARQDELDEVIRTVSQSLFGLTIGCARCHNHKFDPILQRDYYSMQAVFAGLTYGNRRLRGEDNDRLAAMVPEAQQEVAETKAAIEALRVKHGLLPSLADLHTESFDPIAAKAIRMNIQATTSGTASLYELQAWTAPTEGDTSKNVALASSGAKPSASSFALANQTRHFDNLVDGSSDRRQAFPWVASAGGPAWVQVDFAGPATINRIVWDRGSSVPIDYELSVLSAESNEWVSIVNTKRRMPRADDARAADKILIDRLQQNQIAEIVKQLANLRKAQSNLSRLSAGPQVYAASFTDSPQSTWLLRRGDPMQKLQEVEPAIPVVLGNMDYKAGQSEVDRRVALAKHLTEPKHPLTARVIVNRVWQHHFGEGLVDSPSDLGKMGSQPSHPQLLDWLADEFVTGGWSLKKLHRLILLSQTFRQSSRPRADCLAVDAESRFLWRFPPRRLEAEAIRDSILFVSGKLDSTMGGRGYDLFRQRGGLSGYTPIETFDKPGWRRMIYAHKIRMQSVDIFGSFDCPDAGQMKPKRTRSITPLQSLSLLNSPFLNRQAAFFAQRLQASAQGTDEQVRQAFLIAFARSPDATEHRQMMAFVGDHGLEQLCRVLFNTSEFVSIQ